MSFLRAEDINQQLERHHRAAAPESEGFGDITSMNSLLPPDGNGKVLITQRGISVLK